MMTKNSNKAYKEELAKPLNKAQGYGSTRNQNQAFQVIDGDFHSS